MSIALLNLTTQAPHFFFFVNRIRFAMSDVSRLRTILEFKERIRSHVLHNCVSMEEASSFCAHVFVHAYLSNIELHAAKEELSMLGSEAWKVITDPHIESLLEEDASRLRQQINATESLPTTSFAPSYVARVAE